MHALHPMSRRHTVDLLLWTCHDDFGPLQDVSVENRASMRALTVTPCIVQDQTYPEL